MSYAYPEYFLDIPNGRKKIIDLINLNITSCVAMTQIVMKEMAGENNYSKARAWYLGEKYEVYQVHQGCISTMHNALY